MEKTSKICQSCGMPMRKDPQGGGTNADGSLDPRYCSYCYQNGEFTFAGTVKEFQEYCRKMMIENGYSKFLAWLFTRGMRRLERWKNTLSKENMKNKKLLFLVLGCLLVVFAGCDKENWDASFRIEGLTIDNYPKVDGSTTTIGLQRLIACKLLGYSYDGITDLDGAYAIAPSQEVPERYWECIQSSKTHESFIRLIDREVDFILTARTLSDSEKKHAENTGVMLIETPVALDAFVFITHPDNTTNALTTKQIQDIYTGKTNNWKDVGGKDAPIQAFRRNKDSGSQELMESLVMQGMEMIDLPNEFDILSMMGVYHALAYEPNGLCYTVYYYNELMVRNKIAKMISVDGVYPNNNTLKNKTYPYTTGVYAVIRSDLDKSSMAYKIYELLLTEAGQRVISESGYILNQ